MTRILVTLLLLTGLSTGASAQSASATAANAGAKKADAPKIVTLPSGLQYVDEVVGTGPVPAIGQKASVHCTGRLTDSTIFWSTTDPKFNFNKPLDFSVGKHQMIKGFDEGVQTMHVGGRRKVIIPPALGYGERGAPPAVPGNATLVFTIELLSVN